MTPDRDVVAEQTVALREEVREAYQAWQADIHDVELSLDYFDKLDRLDHNLAERGLERGEHIDEELPARWLDQSEHEIEGGLSAEQIKAIFDERAAIMDLVEAIADDAAPERIEALVERYEEAAQVRRALGLTDHQLESSEPISLQVAGDRTVKALLIPVDPSRPVQMIEVSDRDDLRQHVGGLPEATRYDYDSIIYISDTGRVDGQAMNTRATDYIRRESEAARQGKMIGIDPSYGLCGTAVVVGHDEHGLRDVPDRLVARFNGAEREQASTVDKIREAIKDRNEDGMIRIPWRRDPDSGGRMWHVPLGINTRLQIATMPGERPTFYVYDRRQDKLLREAHEYETALRDRGIQDLDEYHLGFTDGYVAGSATDAPRGFEHPEPTDYDLGHREGYAQGQAEREHETQAPEQQSDDWLKTVQTEMREREQDKGRDDQERGV
jgi:hypothetical protein